jgi:Fe-Mn family superoxide dismutase
MEFTLPELPYPDDALAPHISQETLQYHWGKHHAAYVKNLNGLVQGTEFDGMSLEDIVRKASGPLFNNAAQHWNHSFYWKCMSGDGGGEPGGALMDALAAAFGSFEDFKREFSDVAGRLFGSGWVWLVADGDGSLSVQQCSNAANPMTGDRKPLLVCDVWEHAYYIDYRNERPRYVEAFWSVIDWAFVERNLG